MRALPSSAVPTPASSTLSATPSKKSRNRIKRLMDRLGVTVSKKSAPIVAPAPPVPTPASVTVPPHAPFTSDMLPPALPARTFSVLGPALPAKVLSDDAEIAAPALIDVLQNEEEANRLFIGSPRFCKQVRTLIMNSTIKVDERAAIVDAVRFNDVAPESLKDLAAYADYLANDRVASVHGLSNHIYAGGSAWSYPAKQLGKEVAFLHEHLPIDLSAPVLFRFDETNLQRGKMLIVGAPGTPYSGGVFLFHFNAADYPNVPPQVTFATTNGGQFRFNPNLYANGKVCLSLLGTWGDNDWKPKKSNFLQIACSIQTAVMNANPYVNEPGFERAGNTDKARAYRENVEQATVQYAMIDAINKPDPDFADFIKLHFKVHKDRVEMLARKWVQVKPTQRTALANAITKLQQEP